MLLLALARTFRTLKKVCVGGARVGVFLRFKPLT